MAIRQTKTEVLAAMPIPAAVTDVRDPRPSESKSRVAGAVLALITLALFVIVNLPYRYAESEVKWVGYLEVADGGSYRTYSDFPIMAGWPLRYMIRYVDGDQIQNRLWSPARLAVNLGIGVFVAAGVYLFVQFRRRKLNQSSESQRVRLIFDCGVAIAILLVPGTLFMWQYRTTRHHLDLARDLERVGSSCLSCWLPAAYSELIPAGLKRRLARLRQVHIYGAPDATVHRITSVPTIAAYHCYGGKFDAKPLEKLLDNPHFCVLQLNHRNLSEADLAVIRRFRWLDQLQLSRTTLDSEQLKSLGHLPLKLVDLSFTKVELSEIGKAPWSSTLEVLTVSRPADGAESSLTIEGWPNLRRLQIERESSELNDAVMSVRLVDLPRLKRLHIDRVQKHDLVLRNVPRLSRIDEEISDPHYSSSSDILKPGLTWLRSLEIDGADSLTSIGCYAKDLERFSIRRAPNLRKLSIGSYLSSFLGEIKPQIADPKRSRVWIEQVGTTMDGPAEVDLSFMPLATNDLSLLSRNKGIRHLNLNGSGVTFSQIQQLAGLESLESLVIPTIQLKQDELAWMLNQFPNLRDLSVDVSELSSFDLTGRDRLRELRITPMGKLEVMRIVDLPRLRTCIRLTQSPEKLEIRNVPSLRGLAIEGPWPKTAELHGLRDLEWFTGGGREIDDQVVDVLLQCDSLDRLTLAYPSVSEETLRRIGTLKELTFLALPGANVNDDVVRDWCGLTSLWEVNLDDTQISVDTIGWLSRMESLRRLSINRVPLTEAAADAVAELDQVSELYLAGVSMSRKNLRKLLKRSNLESLDLSGWEIDEELLEILCSDGTHLKHLILRDNEVDRPIIQRLLAATPTLYVDMGGIPDFVDRPLLEELHRRARVLGREMNAGWRLMLRPRDDVYQTMSAGYVIRGGPDQNQTGHVPSLPITYMTYLNRQLFLP